MRSDLPPEGVPTEARPAEGPRQDLITEEDLEEYFDRRASLYQALVRVGAQLLNNPSLGEDIAQGTYERMLKRIRKDPPIKKGDLSKYCRKAARNLALTIRAKIAKEVEVNQDFLEASALETELDVNILQEVSLLPPRHRVVLVLTATGHTDAEIQAQAGITSQGNVRLLRYEARKMLRERLNLPARKKTVQPMPEKKRRKGKILGDGKEIAKSKKELYGMDQAVVTEGLVIPEHITAKVSEVLSNLAREEERSARDQEDSIFQSIVQLPQKNRERLLAALEVYSLMDEVSRENFSRAAKLLKVLLDEEEEELEGQE